jgi:hypothetical protein
LLETKTKPALVMKYFYSLILLFPLLATAQCDEGQVSVEFRIFTDAWAYESYWQLTPGGEACGNNIIAEGANLNVGCDATAAENSPEGYDNNTIIVEGPFCLTQEEFYDLHFIDSYGDGGLTFEIYENGALTGLFTGQGAGNLYNFQVGVSNTPVYDQPCGALEVMPNMGAIELDNTFAIAGYGEIAPAGGGCNFPGRWCEGASTKSVWAYFIAEAGQSYRITTCGDVFESFDTQLAVYRAGDCGDFSSYTLIASNDDRPGGCATSNQYSSETFISCAEDGEVIYVQIDGYYGENGICSLEVESFEGAPQLASVVNNINCPVNKGEQGSGSIVAYVLGAGLDLQSYWTGPNGFESFDNIINELSSGTYTLEVTTACGDVFTGSYTIAEPTPWNAFITSSQPACENSDDGLLNAFVSGATEPYDFAWTGPADFTSESQNLEGIGSGQYFLNITDDNGCNYPLNFNLLAENDFDFEFGGPITICSNEIYSLEGPSNFSYLWFDGSEGDSFMIDAGDFGLGNHSILATVSDPNGCNDISTFSFFVDDCVINVEETDLNTNVYPNPFSQEVNVSFGIPVQDATVLMIDELGRTVWLLQNYSGNRLTIEPNIASGIYTLSIRTNSQSSAMKIIKK